MGNNVLIIQNRFDLVMRSIAKIIKIKLKLSPVILNINQMDSHSKTNIPRLIIFDQTAVEKNHKEVLEKCKNYFPSAGIIIITIESNSILEKALNLFDEVDVINLWQAHTPIFDLLIMNIQNKIQKTNVFD